MRKLFSCIFLHILELEDLSFQNIHTVRLLRPCSALRIDPVFRLQPFELGQGGPHLSQVHRKIAAAHLGMCSTRYSPGCLAKTATGWERQRLQDVPELLKPSHTRIQHAQCLLCRLTSSIQSVGLLSQRQNRRGSAALLACSSILCASGDTLRPQAIQILPSLSVTDVFEEAAKTCCYCAESH